MRRIFAALLVGLVGLGAAACSSTEESDQTVSSSVVVLDVRTPEEYANGHLEGARNIDWNGASFADEAASLSPDQEYLVYCQSGNRSGQAVQYLNEAGFTSVKNGGGVDEAADATGLPIVTD
jgi:Rhodanese-related sulfurtransferase